VDRNASTRWCAVAVAIACHLCCHLRELVSFRVVVSSIGKLELLLSFFSDSEHYSLNRVDNEQVVL